MRGVDRDRVDVHRARAGSTRSSRSAPTPTAAAQRSRPRAVTRRVREVLALLDVLDRDQAAQAAVLVDERQLLDAVLLQHRLRLLQRRADVAGDEPLATS